MAKNIDIEISRLADIQEIIINFKNMKTEFPNTIPISQAKYDELLRNNCLKNDIFYYILDREVGQYIDGFIDI